MNCKKKRKRDADREIVRFAWVHECPIFRHYPLSIRTLICITLEKVIPLAVKKLLYFDREFKVTIEKKSSTVEKQTTRFRITMNTTNEIFRFE